MHNALFMGWNRVVPGKESQAMELYQEVMAYWGQQQAAGKIESFQPVVLSPHGGDLNGFILVVGDVDNLNTIRKSEEYASLSMRMNLVCMNYGATSGYHGEAMAELMQRWSQLI